MPETWLKDNQKLLDYVDIPGYNLEYANRDNTRGVGVGVYIKETFTCTERKDMINLDKSIEHYWLEVSGLTKTARILLGSFINPALLKKKKENGFIILKRFTQIEWSNCSYR